jgi:DNA-binding LytR/AlgR family response regulator
MNVIILEDETRASNFLARLINKVAPEMTIVARFETIRDSTHYLKANPDVSLIFSDVQLADGLSFEIFRQVQVNCPIIFTTAYDHYAIEAFKTNGIDYLLKPIEEERLLQAIGKALKFTPSLALEKVLALANATSDKKYKSRFMVKVADKIRSIPIEDILAFYSLEKSTFIQTIERRSYPIDYTLDQAELLLDPETCFKINRKYIVTLKACNQIVAWSNSRLRLIIDGIDDQEIIVARERVQDFKNWLDR